MRAIALLLAVALFPSLASATSFICAFHREDRAPYSVKINQEQKTAVLRYAEIMESFRGTVTRTTRSDDGADVYNLSFTDVTPARKNLLDPEAYKLKDTEWEFVLKQNGKNSSFSGTAYVVEGGKRYVSRSLGEFSMGCGQIPD